MTSMATNPTADLIWCDVITIHQKPLTTGSQFFAFCHQSFQPSPASQATKTNHKFQVLRPEHGARHGRTWHTQEAWQGMAWNGKFRPATRLVSLVRRGFHVVSSNKRTLCRTTRFHAACAVELQCTVFFLILDPSPCSSYYNGSMQATLKASVSLTPDSTTPTTSNIGLGLRLAGLLTFFLYVRNRESLAVYRMAGNNTRTDKTARNKRRK